MTLAACSVIPKGPRYTPPPPPPTKAPSSSTLPMDGGQHRVALLVPTTGPNGAAGQSIANAATMALLDTGAKDLRVTTYDTATGATAAAQHALADGNGLILGPLLSDDVSAVIAVARPAHVPLVTFSNDETIAAKDVFVMGNLPGASMARTISYAQSQGVNVFSALVPRGEYGDRASAALLQTARAKGSKVLNMQTYDRSAASITAAAQRLRAQGGYQAVLIADGGSLSSSAATALKSRGMPAGSPRLLGTELWSGDKAITANPALSGAWFASVSDARFPRFAASYRTRYGKTPYRIATLGYDGVLLTLRAARDWQAGRPFPVSSLINPDGFLGLDGAFRFGRDGVIERALEVREIRPGGATVISPAPTSFAK
ncbi:penicillin-binding protein activator [Novosphingobium sp. 9]|uniref:penicillin-binding protein activator n=1 Tax=Novosphingobium sp. 9 TaxID=2025349 RepID=UPI0021B5E66D|nr:penicillin-binding protein activator [Novosphingobium sp. 9]